MAEKKLQTEMVSLPSKGLLYPEGSPLRNGTVEVKYMTAKEEDTLTHQTYIKSGVVFDKLLEALVVSPISFKDILIGDKNAIMVAARVYGYGPHYVFNYTNPGTNDDEEVISIENSLKKPIGCGIIFRIENLISIGLYNDDMRLNEEKELMNRFLKEYKI